MAEHEYILMNKDNPLMIFKLNEVIGGYKAIELERYTNIMPPGFTDINTWLDNRNYAKHKEHLKRWLHEWEIDNSKGFINITHCLSLNDSLWVKKAESVLKWDNVNLYTNPFNDVVSRTAFEKGLHGLRLSTTSPEFTSEGSFAKCWIKEEDNIYLYKKGSYGFANAGLEPYSEYYASELAQIICNDSVSYDLVHYKNELCSKCLLFTSSDEGFVPIYKYLDSSKTYTISDILNFCSKLGFENDYRRMIVLDSIIYNVDRHTGNFGFIINNDTFEIKRFAPVFDHNMSLLCRAMDIDFKDIDAYITLLGHKMGGEFTNVARQITTPAINNVLKSIIEYSLPIHNKYNLPEDRLRSLNLCIKNQIRSIVENKNYR